MAKNSEVEQPRLNELDVFIGNWDTTMSGAWFLDSLETEVKGSASFEWLEDAFVLWKWRLEAEEMPEATRNVIGYSSAKDKFEMFYHDGRGISRIFDVTFDGKTLDMTRQDPDFHQQITLNIDGDTINGATYASDDQGKTWRKDFDLTFAKKV